jgi:glycosyltransferase involved in cell wall biosynthesis
MKIAYDLRRIKNPGIGRYMKCLTRAVLEQAPGNDYLMILPPDASPEMRAQTANVVTITTPVECYSIREQLELPRILRRYGADVLHSPHFNMPLACTCPVVVTIHDLIYRACQQDLPSRLGRMYYHGMTAAAVRLADRVITDSEFSRRDIVRFLKCDPDKIEVVYPGVDPIFHGTTDCARIDAVRSRYRIDDDYILYLGIYKPRKNHAGLLRAFCEFLANGSHAQLVIAGPLQEGEAELRGMARDLRIAERVVFTGFVPEEDLPILYSGAKVYACPSLYEGFGFTVLEAMACGVPVVCFRETSLPEVAGDAALYADPRSPAGFAAALARASSDRELRADLVAKGSANCKRFNWQGAARQALAVYQRIAHEPAGEAVCA